MSLTAPPSPEPANAASAERHPSERVFIDPDHVPALYADQARVNRRSGALLSAKVEGLHVGELIADLVSAVIPEPVPGSAVIADIGCGSGRPTKTLARRFALVRFLALDASAEMLTAARAHLEDQQVGVRSVAYLRADFHHLPLAGGSCHAAVAAFCLYHSPDPAKAIAEIARCLVPGGAAVLVTKSADSYHELDELVAATGLDPEAIHRPSLYEAAHSGILENLTATALTVDAVLHDRHIFRFRNAHHLAEYLTTVPKYQFPQSIGASPEDIAEELRLRRGDSPITTSSTITCITARRTP
jgi:SAM-dependent methyltransferase